MTDTVNPQGRARCVMDQGTLMVFDGDGGFGQHVGKSVMQAAIERVRQHGHCIVTLRRSHHLGRMGHYREMVAAAGLVLLSFTNVINRAPVVASFGGRVARLTTNPLCFASPMPNGRPEDTARDNRRAAGTIRAMKSLWSAFIKLLVLAVIGGALLAAIAILAADRQLPSLDALTAFRRTPDYVPIGKIPRELADAVVAIEDERFYVHDGIDYIGVVRAGVANLADDLSQGASTITMQVARNFYLSRDKTYTRKLYEVLLSYRIEKALTKDEILELYMNKIYLGQGAYGFADAARTYFGKRLDQLTLAECAMLAGLPKAPSANNPVANPKRARQRQVYILQRMLELGRISRWEYDGALLEPLRLR